MIGTPPVNEREFAACRTDGNSCMFIRSDSLCKQIDQTP